jgi:hypothetical protein
MLIFPEVHASLIFHFHFVFTFHAWQNYACLMEILHDMHYQHEIYQHSPSGPRCLSRVVYNSGALPSRSNKHDSFWKHNTPCNTRCQDCSCMHRVGCLPGLLHSKQAQKTSEIEEVSLKAVSSTNGREQLLTVPKDPIFTVRTITQELEPNQIAYTHSNPEAYEMTLVVAPRPQSPPIVLLPRPPPQPIRPFSPLGELAPSAALHAGMLHRQISVGYKVTDPGSTKSFLARARSKQRNRRVMKVEPTLVRLRALREPQGSY